MKFDSHLDLARLPYFKVQDGRIRADPAVGPVIDMHTHLAMSFGVGPGADLTVLTERTEHYLGVERAIDLDLYANKNFLPEDLSRLEKDLSLGALTARGMRATHTAPNLVREMDELGIRHSVLLPIEFPVLSHNARAFALAARGREALVAFGSVHPFTPNLAAALDAQVALGVRGIKFHPAVQLVAPENWRALYLFRLCAARGLPILMHCGPVEIETRLGRWLSQVRRYEKPIAEVPGATFILGHSGALQMEQALALCKRYPNVYLELSSQGVPALKKILDEAPPDRLVFGTDWPFYHQAFGLAKALLATEGREHLRGKIFYENAARLLGLKKDTARP